MPARIGNKAAHALDITLNDTSTGGPMTNSGARSTGGLENIGTATTHTFTMVEVIKVKETCNVPASTPPVAGTTDGLETTAGPYIQVKNIQIPSSYKGDSLSFSHPNESDKNPTNFMIFPDVKITVDEGSYTQTTAAGVGEQIATATIDGPVREMDDWVIPWNDPVAGIPKFDGSDFATTKSAGYGREVGVFVVTFDLEYGILDKFGPASGPPTAYTSSGGIPAQTKSWSITIINNADNDRDVYIQKYEEAYKSLTKVPELSERT